MVDVSSVKVANAGEKRSFRALTWGAADDGRRVTVLDRNVLNTDVVPDRALSLPDYVY